MSEDGRQTTRQGKRMLKFFLVKYFLIKRQLPTMPIKINKRVIPSTTFSTTHTGKWKDGIIDFYILSIMTVQKLIMYKKLIGL